MILCICTMIKPRCYANSHYGAEHVLVNTVVLVIFATRVIKSKEIKIRAFLPFCGQTTMLSWSICTVYAVVQIGHKSSLRQLHALLQWPELVSAISCKNPFCLNKPGFFPNSSWKCWDASLYSPFRNSRSAIIYKHGSENMKHFSTLTLHLHKFVMLLQLSLIPRLCTFVACSTKFAQRVWAHSSRDVCHPHTPSWHANTTNINVRVANEDMYLCAQYTVKFLLHWIKSFTFVKWC